MDRPLSLSLTGTGGWERYRAWWRGGWAGEEARADTSTGLSRCFRPYRGRWRIVPSADRNPEVPPCLPARGSGFPCVGRRMSATMVVPVVSTASGKVRGAVQYTNDLPDKPVYTFLGIPYAAPPVGDLRFRAPQPAAPWEGVRDATELGPYCPQDTAFLHNMVVKQQHYNLDEDCLTLNIETPTIAKDAGLPVLLWIHGGGLYAGAGYFLPYTSLAAHQDVVVVTFNYRLGVLGFFSTGDENAPGNFGFLDQVQAMVWVQENIRNFGGDPNQVTIFGESAGGASVCYHVVSPLSKGLFQRAISQSGVSQTCDTFSKPLERAVMLAEELGCDTRDTANMVACLRQKSTDELNSGTLEVLKKLIRQGASLPTQPFSPAIDGHFLPAEPAVIFDTGRANAVDYLLGVNNHEFGFLLPMTLIPGYGRGMTEDKYLRSMKRRVDALYPGFNLNNMVAEIRKLYRDCYSGDDPMSLQYQFTQACGDHVFVAPTVSVANKHSGSGQKVYLYDNHYVPSRFAAGRPDWVGCDHGDELFVMSGVAFVDVPMTSGRLLRFSADDKKASLDMMAYWANFARTGNPSDCAGGPADSPTVPEWPQYTPDNPAYMKLDLMSSADVGLHPDRMALWNDVIPKLAAPSKL
ncbi:liver carboxylesterase-like isoform X2 [Branchiostoma lanceolatum]|uniref:liver carboxylesterase-like isoform X2 n=1 Tax=Branchiostoma lanceolatum TaxID=7740 RepID=UPI003455A7D3